MVPRIPLITATANTMVASEPHSFSKFVMPFTYQGRLKEERTTPGPWFKPGPIKDLDRTSYFTPETAKSLFVQPRHYKLVEMESCERNFTFVRGDRRLKVVVADPELVLFPGIYEDSPDDPLRIGFLILTLSFMGSEQNPVYLDDLLELNELYRYCREPYVGHFYERFRVHFVEDASGTDRQIYVERWMKWLRCASGLAVEEGNLTACGDHRAFVWTCAILEKGSLTVREAVSAEFMPEGDHELGHWIRLLNIDRPASGSARGSKYETQWSRERTYTRWEEFGSLYGVHYHGGAMLAPPEKNPPLWLHFMGIYFDQTLLLLYLRVTLFQFSESLRKLSSRKDPQPPTESAGTATTTVGSSPMIQEQWRQRFRDLRLAFALFSNQYGFPLLSNQQQGIEMYTLAREHMDVRELFEQVRQSIHDSHEYLQGEAEFEQAVDSTKLTQIATIGLPLSIAAGVFGMNMFNDKNLGDVCTGLMYFVVLSVVLLVPSLVYVYVRVSKGQRCGLRSSKEPL